MAGLLLRVGFEVAVGLVTRITLLPPSVPFPLDTLLCGQYPAPLALPAPDSSESEEEGGEDVYLATLGLGAAAAAAAVTGGGAAGGGGVKAPRKTKKKKKAKQLLWREIIRPWKPSSDGWEGQVRCW